MDLFTARIAVRVLPDTVTVPLPSKVAPREKEAFPVGPPLPEAAFTVAVRTVKEPGATPAGVAVTEVTVATGAAVTDTVTGVDADPAKPLSPP